MNKRPYFLVVLILMIETIIILYHVLSGVGSSYFRDQGSAKAEERNIDSVNVAVISKSMFMGNSNAYGRVRSSNFTEIRIPNYNASGVYIDSIQFNPGSIVSKGDILVQLRCEEVQYKLEAAIKDFLRSQNYFDRLKRARNNVSDYEYNQANLDMQKKLAEMRSVKTVFDSMSIRAPFDGTAGIPKVVVGEQVHPNQIVTIIVDDDNLNVEFHVDYLKSKDLQVADIVEVKDKDRVGSEASIIGISPFIDESNNQIEVLAKIDVPNKLVHNLGVDVSIDNKPWFDVYVIPFSALIQDGNQYYVCKAIPIKSKTNLYQANYVSVQFIEQQDTSCAIMSDGLEDGDFIVIEGRITREGQMVEIQHKCNW